MGYTIIPVTPFAQNCSLLWCDATRKTAVIDPGGDEQLIISAVAEHRLKPVNIILTHGHLDHVGATAVIAEYFGIPVIGPHQDDAYLLQRLEEQSQMFGFPMPRQFTPERWLQQGDAVEVGELTLHVLHCPGHTPGHVVLHDAQNKLLFAGDVLFRGAIGRTDFPRGNHQQLINSIRRQLWPLADDVTVIPGHGPETTIGHERATNPFVPD
ncbi:MAG: MBL fold metallo-hydrolase [Pseudomonadota bacterium]